MTANWTVAGFVRLPPNLVRHAKISARPGMIRSQRSKIRAPDLARSEERSTRALAARLSRGTKTILKTKGADLSARPYLNTTKS